MFIPNSELLVVDSLQGKRQRDEWSIINADYVLPVIFVQTAVQKCLKLQSSYDPGLTMLSSIFFSVCYLQVFIYKAARKL